MKCAMVSATIERVGNVRINSENFHSVKLIPNRAIGRDEFREGCGGRRKIRSKVCDGSGIGGRVGGPKEKGETLQQTFTRITRRNAAQPERTEVDEEISKFARVRMFRNETEGVVAM